VLGVGETVEHSGEVLECRHSRPFNRFTLAKPVRPIVLSCVAILRHFAAAAKALLASMWPNAGCVIRLASVTGTSLKITLHSLCYFSHHTRVRLGWASGRKR